MSTVFLAVGESTKTIYASGSKADCLRNLQEKYPSRKHIRGNYKDYGKSVDVVLPEPMILIQKGS